jgi:serine/threonine protein phosphatase 1
MRAFTVGDIHGRDDLLELLREQISTNAKVVSLHNHLIFLRDYIDRGPQSQAVIEPLLALDWPGWEIICGGQP